MKQHFEKQLEEAQSVSKDRLEELKGKSLYTEYQEGDKIVVFLTQSFSKTDEHILIGLVMIAERELDKLKKDFNFIRMASKGIPVLEKKNENHI